MNSCNSAPEPAQVKELIHRPKSKWRPYPLDTIQLERLASRYLRMNAKQIMSIAERLYQNGFISYPRQKFQYEPSNLFSYFLEPRPIVIPVIMIYGELPSFLHRVIIGVNLRDRFWRAMDQNQEMEIKVIKHIHPYIQLNVQIGNKNALT